MKPKIIFFGNERISSGYSSDCLIFKALIDSDYDIQLVVANQTELANSRSTRHLEIADVATRAGIPIMTPSNPSEIIDHLRSITPDIGVLVAYGKIITQELINIFPKGIVNVHPSLLPKYRGSTPIEQAILDGAKETGVSLMQLVKEMDAGPVYAQKTLALTGKETKKELTDQLVIASRDLLLEHLPGIAGGALTPRAQKVNCATYCKQIKKTDGQIDWAKPATLIEREIRAFAGWPKSYTKLGDIDVIITKAHSVPSDFGDIGEIEIADEEYGIVIVQTGDGYLCIDKLHPNGKKEMTMKEFLRGYKDRLKAHAAFEAELAA